MKLIWNIFTRSVDWQANENYIPKFIYSTLKNNNLVGSEELISKSWYKSMKYTKYKNYKGFENLIDSAKKGKAHNNFSIGLTDKEESWYFNLMSFPKGNNCIISIKLDLKSSVGSSNKLFEIFKTLVKSDICDTSYIHTYERFGQLNDMTRVDAYFENPILDMYSLPGVYWCNYWSSYTLNNIKTGITKLFEIKDKLEYLEINDSILLRISNNVFSISDQKEEEKMLEIANLLRKITTHNTM